MSKKNSVEAAGRNTKCLERLYKDRTNVEVVEAVKRTEKWLGRLYQERRTNVEVVEAVNG